MANPPPPCSCGMAFGDLARKWVPEMFSTDGAEPTCDAIASSYESKPAFCSQVNDGDKHMVDDEYPYFYDSMTMNNAEQNGCFGLAEDVCEDATYDVEVTCEWKQLSGNCHDSHDRCTFDGARNDIMVWATAAGVEVADITFLTDGARACAAFENLEDCGSMSAADTVATETTPHQVGTFSTEEICTSNRNIIDTMEGFLRVSPLPFHHTRPPPALWPLCSYVCVCVPC